MDEQRLLRLQEIMEHESQRQRIQSRQGIRLVDGHQRYQAQYPQEIKRMLHNGRSTNIQ